MGIILRRGGGISSPAMRAALFCLTLFCSLPAQAIPVNQQCTVGSDALCSCSELISKGIIKNFDQCTQDAAIKACKDGQCSHLRLVPGTQAVANDAGSLNATFVKPASSVACKNGGTCSVKTTKCRCSGCACCDDSCNIEICDGYCGPCC